MKIYLESGKDFVWQWDIEQRIVLEGYPAGVTVHYANCKTQEAPVVVSKMDGDKLVADIPPELMQEPHDITAYACDENSTRHCCFIHVIARPKPESYLYEPVEILRWETLDARLQELSDRKLDSDALPEAVEDALAQAKASGEFDGQRGNGILPVTTEPSAYAVDVGGKISIARMALEVIRAEAGVEEVLVGDLIACGCHLYHVYYVDVTWAFMDTCVSVRGAQGEPGMAHPLVLDAQTDYTADSAKGDEALEAIIRNRQILVRTPNADGGKFTAIYSPILTYQIPNYENNYLYLFYLRDEKQDLSGTLGVDIKVPVYGELKMLLSKTYNESPLVNPQEHLSDTLVYIKGDPGRGIRSIVRTGGDGGAGTVDTYTITYTDGTTGTYQVRNGADGSDGVTPHIGANGNWYLGDTDTGVKAQGPKGDKGDPGAPGSDYVLTDEDRQEIAKTAVALLPRYEGGVA